MTLEELRTSRSYSQIEVARELQVTAAAVSKWESGLAKPQAVNIRGLAKLYNVEIKVIQDAIIETSKK